MVHNMFEVERQENGTCEIYLDTGDMMEKWCRLPTGDITITAILRKLLGVNADS